MSKSLYARLAVNNIKKNSQAYIPYILTCIGIIAMFYNMAFLTAAKDIGSISSSSTIRTILFFGETIIGIFSVIFLFYTNSFLIKRRKKEFGLFNILGMEKKHIAKIMFYETLFIALISLGIGIGAGILFSKLIILLLFKIISFKATFGFEVPLTAVSTTAMLFIAIFVLNLIYNVYQVHLSKPIELLKGGDVGEKEPKTKWLSVIIGALCLGLGYYIALTIEAPLDALNIFFIAVVLVIIGTYCLFTAGSIAVLKMLRKNKRYYYKPEHFVSVSGMIYRMKQNAVGLANICILSTAVIVMLAITFSTYIGMEDILRTHFPRNIIFTVGGVSEEQVSKLDDIIEKQTAAAGVIPQDVVRCRFVNLYTIQNGAAFTAEPTINYYANNRAVIYFVLLEDYNKMEGKSVSLKSDEVLLYAVRGNIPADTISFDALELSVKERLKSFDAADTIGDRLVDNYFIVVDSMDTINRVYDSMNGNGTGTLGFSYYYGFDVVGGKSVQSALTASLNKTTKDAGISIYAECVEDVKTDFYATYGGLFFLGLFLGILFIAATVLIIYYKQIAEGYDDKKRFEIMQKVGMSRDEIKKSIRSQVLSVFFMPLVTAAIHVAFAFKIMTKLLSVLNMTNIPLFATYTAAIIAIFAAFYITVYALTARAYYKIVS